MKRESVKYTNVALEAVYNHYGVLFWQDCLFCGQEFRHEKGYRFQLQINRGWVYSCGVCCSSKDEVNTKVGELRKLRPKPPVAPPTKRNLVTATPNKVTLDQAFNFISDKYDNVIEELSKK